MRIVGDGVGTFSLKRFLTLGVVAAGILAVGITGPTIVLPLLAGERGSDGSAVAFALTQLAQIGRRLFPFGCAAALVLRG